MFRKILIVLFLLISIVQTSNIKSLNYTRNKSNHINSQVLVLNDAIFELFVHREIPFDVVLYGKRTSVVNDTLNEALRRHLDRYAVRIQQYDHPREMHRFDSAALIFFDSTWMLTECFKLFELSNNFSSTFKFLLYVSEGISMDNFISLLSPWQPNANEGHFIQFAYFLIETKEKIELKTFEWWTRMACGVRQFIEVNTFNRTELIWEKPLHITEKFTNFHNCSFLSFSRIFKVFLIDLINDNGVWFLQPELPIIIAKKENVEIKLIDIFASLFNFSYDRTSFKDEKNIEMYHASVSFSRKLYCGSAWTYHIIHSMISPPEKYTSYEKMIMPFDFLTWMFLIMTFCGAYLGIFITNQMPMRVRDIVFGKRVKVSFLDLMRVFFGVGQKILPKNHFARINLVFFIMFCLIFRVAYQGKNHLLKIY